MITIPNSIQTYLKDSAVQEATDTLTGSKDTSKLNLPLSELASFYKAKLSAEKIKTDWWLFFYDVFNTVVVKKLTEIGYKEDPQNYDADETEESWKSIDSVWSNSILGACFLKDSNSVEIYIKVDEELENIFLQIAHAKGEDYLPVKETDLLIQSEDDADLLISKTPSKIEKEAFDTTLLEKELQDFIDNFLK